jgi:hypothetical protein
MVKPNSKINKKEESKTKVELDTLKSYKKIINMINDYNKKYGRSIKINQTYVI